MEPRQAIKKDELKKHSKQKPKLMIAVEYLVEEDYSTFEIFETIKEAYNFINTFLDKKGVIGVFVADFNPDYIYKEEGVWNYEDNSALYGYKVDISLPNK